MDPKTTTDASRELLNYGVLGVLCLLLLAAVVYLYRARSKADQEYVAKLEGLLNSHSAATKQMFDSMQTQADEHAEALKAMSKEHASALMLMAKEHKSELQILEERYIKTFETTTNKYYELQKSMMEFMIELKQTVNLLVKTKA